MKKMNLQFSGKELAAIIKLALSMIMADGKVDEKEKASLALEMVRFGIKEEQLAGLVVVAQTMDAAEAISIISGLAQSEKKYVAAFLGALMAIDGDINDTEMKLWQLTSTLCNLPTMNITQALQTMNNL
ncbi:MAG: tellurite resistance protein TerB [Prevotella sp.]|nr:tellurite resistance protein TerB [Prevotella sp.]